MKNKFLILLAFVFSMISFSCETVYLDASPTASIDAGAAYSTTKMQLRRLTVYIAHL